MCLSTGSHDWSLRSSQTGLTRRPGLVVLANAFLMHHRKTESNGLYNLGSGKARTFLDLAHATFDAMGKPRNVSFIDTPEDIRDTYQYFTEADMSKLKSIGYDRPFASLEKAIEDYVHHYLNSGKRWTAPKT